MVLFYTMFLYLFKKNTPLIVPCESISGVSHKNPATCGVPISHMLLVIMLVVACKIMLFYCDPSLYKGQLGSDGASEASP